MVDIIKPQNKEDLKEAISWAASSQSILEVISGGSKRDLGRPIHSKATLDMTAFNGIIDYDPSELFFKAGAATPIVDIEKELESNNQMLAFEPINLSNLLNVKENKSTIVGSLSANLSGPRRIKAGAVRDHFLGFEGVSGRGEGFKAGGQVVKNVTGYDLCKLLCGSWGTLGVLHTVNIKVLPSPETTRTLVIYNLNEEEAIECFTLALNSPNEISGAAWLPDKLSTLSDIDYISSSGSTITAIRFEGIKQSVVSRMKDLQSRFETIGEVEELHSLNSRKFWREIRDIKFLVFQEKQMVWRLSVPPICGGKVYKQIIDGFDSSVFMDWGGALLWVRVNQYSDEEYIARKIHNIAAQAAGHATCIAADNSIRSSIDVFPPLNLIEHGLTDRIKKGFDPKGILNYGRMYMEL